MARQGSRFSAKVDTLLSTGQERLIPRSILGVSLLLVALSFGAAFSGAVLYAYYQYRLDTNESRVQEYVAGFDTRLETAQDIIAKEQGDAVATVRSELEPLQKIAAGGETLNKLLDKVSGSIFFVSTLDNAGAPSVGSAFVAFGDNDQSFLLTSYATIAAATQDPGPDITVIKGDETIRAQLVSWDPGRDLALLSIDKGGLTRLPWASKNSTQIGDRLFAISGLGAKGGSIIQGAVADISSVGLQHDTQIGLQFQGAPLVNSNGEVVATSSRAYAPLGFTPEDVYFAPPVRDACVVVLRCPEGEASGVGSRQGG